MLEMIYWLKQNTIEDLNTMFTLLILNKFNSLLKIQNNVFNTIKDDGAAEIVLEQYENPLNFLAKMKLFQLSNQISKWVKQVTNKKK
jgi:hypothetical protein